MMRDSFDLIWSPIFNMTDYDVRGFEILSMSPLFSNTVIIIAKHAFENMTFRMMHSCVWFRINLYALLSFVPTHFILLSILLCDSSSFPLFIPFITIYDSYHCLFSTHSFHFILFTFSDWQRDKAMALTVDLERRQGVLKQLENKVKEKNNGSPGCSQEKLREDIPLGNLREDIPLGNLWEDIP